MRAAPGDRQELLTRFVIGHRRLWAWVLVGNPGAYWFHWTVVMVAAGSTAWRQALAELGATGKHTLPHRPQANGEVERFNRTLTEEWAYTKRYTSNAQRTADLDQFLHTYNYHRCHTALGGQPPISRVNNPAGQYS